MTMPDRRRSPSRLPSGSPLIGHVIVGADAGPGEADRSSAAIAATCERFSWHLLEIVRDRESRRIRKRPGLSYALGRIADGHADGLVVSDLQRLSRSIVDLGALLAWFRDAHATLIALDLDIDTSTPEGDQVAATLIALSAHEHQLIASRTRMGLAEVRTNGRAKRRPAVRDRPELMERIATMRAARMTLQAIADQLNAENVPTLRGGAQWRPSSIQAALGYRRPEPRAMPENRPPLTRRYR
ncbi:MAG TPA: recombinase family protein [Baekduia sp.]|uniref:recombinase family protein n=1 Tax=Baekduia sp. TaxID=2600305 RepID=UPI002D1A955D|nr:recombinase family protein [Baekduia sp.]HMJ37316.1 recombinase family protein [Baekduia sp.]